MKFAELAEFFSRMENTTKRLELTEILVELLKSTPIEIISKVVYLIQGKLRPNFEGVELGRYLFYEKKLSGDNTISCASCHSPSISFSDSNQFSVGIDGVYGTRQSMALVNLGWEDFYTWDGSKSSLEAQILEPVPNPIEMHQEWKDAVKKLNQDVLYRNRFFRAFGEEGIDSIKVSKAIAQFLRTLISSNSKYDVM